MALDLSDSVRLFQGLKRHIGHEIELIYYGDTDNPIEVGIECETCFEVLVTQENPECAES